MRAMIFCGLLMSAFGAWQFSLLNLNAGPWNFVVPEIIMGAGLSFLFVPLATITVHPIQPEEMGYATSLIAFSPQLGSAVGISILTTVVARREQFHQVRLTAQMAANSPALAGAALRPGRTCCTNAACPPIAASQGALRILRRQVRAPRLS